MIKSKLFLISSIFLLTISGFGLRWEKPVQAFYLDDKKVSQIKPVINEAVVNEMSKAYGFKLGQDYSLDLIEDKFPELDKQIKIARLKFDLSFEKSILTIDSILLSMGGEWIKIKAQLKDQGKASLNLENINYDQVTEFISTVEKRSEGDIPTPIIGTLLTFTPKYLKDPELEFIDGFKYRYNGRQNEKAKGLDFHIDIPKSWVSYEANRPNIVQKFVSQNGHGIATIMVMVSSLPEGEKMTEEIIKSMIKSGEIKEMIPKDSKFINGGFIKIDNLPGMYQECKIMQTQLDQELLMHSINYILFYENMMLSIQCVVGSLKEEEKYTDSSFIEYKELFRLVANSLVLQSQWIK